MRDFERLEELSATVESGLRANDVIWAIDQALAGNELDQAALDALKAGRDILRDLAHPDAAPESLQPRSTQKMLGGESIRSVRRLVVYTINEEGQEPAENVDAGVVLISLADALDAVANREDAEPHTAALDRSMVLFAAISEIKLGQGNGIMRANKDHSWIPQTLTSSSS